MNLNMLIVQPFMDLMMVTFGFTPKLFTAFCILILGYCAAQLVYRSLIEVLKMIRFDYFSQAIGLTRILETAGEKRKPSVLISSFIYLLMMVMVLIVSVKSLGLVMILDLLNRILYYIPSVITGVLVLIIGMLLAKVVSTIVYITAKNTDMPIPETLARLSKLAIIAFVTIIFLREIGFFTLFAGVHYTIFIAGVILALALAFGLAGRTIAARYLDVLNVRKVS